MKSISILSLVGILFAVSSLTAKTIEQSVTFPDVKPERIYRAYLSAKEHEAFTGYPASIDAREGGEINVFKNVPVAGAFGVTGKILQLDPAVHAADQYVIVQSWRGHHDQPTALDSTLVLTLTTVGTGTQLKLVQVNVPDELADFISQSWQSRYWTPLQAYLSQNPR